MAPTRMLIQDPRSPLGEMGRKALKMVLARGNGEEVQSCSLEPQLIVRAPTVPDVAL